MRSRIWLSAALLVGCTVSNPPPPQYGYQTQQQYPQQQPPPVQQPPPQQTTYQPPPTNPPPPVQYEPPANVDTYEAPPSLPIYTDVSVDPIGDEVPQVEIFYDQLSPYGTWYDDSTYGWVFVPNQGGFQPYTNGHWKYTDYGWTWVSGDPFGWATDHYGRWVWANRWVWRPDTTWGPAWVQWRVSDNWLGWAPLGYTDDAYCPDESWRFVPAAQISSPDVRRYYATANFRVYINGTSPLQRYHRHKKAVWVAGPDDDYIRDHRLQVQRQKFELAEIGRYNADQRREAERRARERQKEWDARKRRDDQIRKQLEVQQRRQEQERERQAVEARRIADERRRDAQHRKELDE